MSKNELVLSEPTVPAAVLHQMLLQHTSPPCSSRSRRLPSHFGSYLKRRMALLFLLIMFPLMMTRPAHTGPFMFIMSVENTPVKKKRSRGQCGGSY